MKPDRRLDADTAWQHAVRWLTARDRSAHEVEARLLASAFPAAVVDATVQRLITAGYLDDARYARLRCEALRQRGHGSVRATAELTAKGIAPAMVEVCIGELFDDEQQLAERTLLQRFQSLPQTPAERGKAARFLANRGFPESVVLAILGEGC